MTKILVSKITLLYSCPNCGETACQALGDIIESGTAVCPECDVDMELEDKVQVEV